MKKLRIRISTNPAPNDQKNIKKIKKSIKDNMFKTNKSRTLIMEEWEDSFRTKPAKMTNNKKSSMDRHK